MKIVFFGTPDYVVDILESLHKRFKARDGKSPIVAVVTQRPGPVGRKKILTYSPVDKWAYEKKIPILYNGRELIEKNVKADVGLLASYGEILPKEIIQLSPHGILNIHPSLLPRWRGASPVAAAIVSGEAETGVTIIKLDEKLDHGPIVSQFREGVGVQDTMGSLRARLFARSAEVLVELLQPYIKGKIKPREQNHSKATFTTLIKKAHGFISPQYIHSATSGKKIAEDWSIPFIKDFAINPSLTTINNFIRAMDPWPGAWTLLRLGLSGQTKRLKILKAHTDNEKLVLDEVQLEGKNPVSWDEFKKGYPNFGFRS